MTPEEKELSLTDENGEYTLFSDYKKKYDYAKQFKIVGGVSVLLGIISIGLDMWFKMNP